MSTLAAPRPKGRKATMVTLTCISCWNDFQLKKSQARQRKRCDDCSTWTFPHSSSGYFVSVAQFAPLFEEVLEERDKQLRHEGKLQDCEASGALYQLAEQVAAQLGHQSTAVVRRMFGIRKREAKVVNTELADAILLAAGRFIEDEQLKTYPCSLRYAREIIEIETENAGIVLTSAELDEAARVRFHNDQREVAAT